MKLKSIPNNIVVHTPTEAEAKELLAILHENGYKWCGDTSLLDDMENKIAYKIMGNKRVTHQTPKYFMDKGFTILTLAEFKEWYCEGEQPQPKFKVGDMAFFPNRDKPMPIHGITDGVAMSWWDDGGIRAAACFEDLTPYTEPETKVEAKQLNLCELLEGHEGEEFFSLAYGEVVLDEIRRGTQRGDSPDFLCVRATTFDSGTIIVNPNGKLRNAGVVDLVPSRALYEQYPLDPYTAWMKWKEGQKKYSLDVNLRAFDSPDTGVLLKFRTSADRDKCIEEIKSVIAKYSKK